MIRTAEKYTTYPGDTGTRYYKYVPSNGVKPIGVILFYHGQGEISSTDLSLVERNHLPKGLAVDGVRSGMEIPFIVIAPQEEPPQKWYGRALTGVTIAKSFGLPIHKCGLSLGSMCDAQIVKDLGSCFASICTVAGQITEFGNTLSEFKKIPTINYYGTSDKVIPYGYESVRDFSAKLKAAGADCTFVEFAGRGHDIWPDAYALTAYIAWLMSKVSAPAPPTRIDIIKTQVEISTGRIIHIDSSGKEY